MHEMSLAVSLVAIVRQEMEKLDAKRLKAVHLRCGVLANVVPEALSQAFQAQTTGSPLEGIPLVMTEEPLQLACGKCEQHFIPAEVTRVAVFAVCPYCAEEIGHRVVAGKELYIDHMEVE